MISNLQVLSLTAHGTVESKTKEGHVTATTQKIGKITDIVRKTTYHRDCQKKTQKIREDNEMIALEYMEWFKTHISFLNHTGNLQVCFLTNFCTCQS